MVWTTIIWDDMGGGNVEHIAEHGLTREDVDYLLSTFDEMDRSRSSENLIVFGWIGGRRIAVVVEEIDDDTVYPVTAYEV